MYQNEESWGTKGSKYLQEDRGALQDQLLHLFLGVPVDKSEKKPDVVLESCVMWLLNLNYDEVLVIVMLTL